MNLKNIEMYFMSDTREESIWTDSIFVFDTSALLNLYYYSRRSQKEISSGLFETIKKRLWIPHHVEFEYLKNRESTLRKPIIEKYTAIEKEVISSLEKNVSLLKNGIFGLAERTKSEEKHPYFTGGFIEEFKKCVIGMTIEFEKFKIELDNEMGHRAKEILELSENDIVLDALSKYFKVGTEYPYSKIMEIIQEGEFRFRSNIPPGYLDANVSNSKDGIQKYGDLIIWKQIISHAKIIKKPIILVTNDVKQDWCYSDKRDDRIERPKEELIKEIRDEAGVDFWMYTFSQFLFKCEKFLKTKLDEEVIDEVENSTVRAIQEVTNDKNIDKDTAVLYQMYTRNALIDIFNSKATKGSWREGVASVDDKIFLFVTLKKADLDNPIDYHDYFLNSSYFHWQSQNSTTHSSQRGQLFVNHEKLGIKVHLFIRKYDVGFMGERRFMYLGQISYVRSKGDKPMSIIWKLHNTLPEELSLELLY